ncbi:acyl carrier protein [Streptomyces avicenniae]|uniref:acyl carrier protein n=1 Tax=Streptomyces avicenniae TaxID=500153 RepID=UPI00069C7C61|nr:acyl carrier protein [Streptomyces avicenniae]
MTRDETDDDSGSREGILAALLETFSRLLPGAKVTPNTHFFDAGGTSLDGVKLLAAVKRSWGVSLRLRDLVTAPSPGSLTDLILVRLS